MRSVVARELKQVVDAILGTDGSRCVEFASFSRLFAASTFFGEQRVELVRDLGVAPRPDRDLEHPRDVAAARLTALPGGSINVGEKGFPQHGIHIGI